MSSFSNGSLGFYVNKGNRCNFSLPIRWSYCCSEYAPIPIAMLQIKNAEEVLMRIPDKRIRLPT
ncbi:hypothetical protein [Anaplasma bovis]|uniref:hypothetical protein n=1 Tax=Anaplasma bovis TaxID=186733 RepID=UPI002FF369CF